MDNKIHTYCDRCDYLISGCFYSCKRCGDKNVMVYRGFHNKDLQARMKSHRLGFSAGSPVLSLAIVGLIVTLIAGAYLSVTSDEPQIKAARQQLLSSVAL
jgi:hypothetical protein